MSEKLVKSIIGLFGAGSALGVKYLIIFIISLMPILELRGGLLAASILGLDPIPSYIICIIGNLIPVPFILWFLDSIFSFMKKHHILEKFVLFCERKGNEKKSKVERLGFWGLVLFVGIPLPGTGAWTGSLIATLLRMDKKKAFLATLIGVIMASIIMMIISYGIIGNLI